ETAASRAGTFGVRAEKAGLHAVRLGESGTDRVEDPGVRRRAGPPVAFDGCLVDDDDLVRGREVAVDERRLARPGDAGDDRDDAERDVDIDVAEVVLAGAADGQRAPVRAHGGLELRTV